VIGAGASALDLAGLLHEVGADVQLVSRREMLIFHSKPAGKPRSWWQQSGIRSRGWSCMRSRFYSGLPMVFHYLPERIRLDVVRRALGPSGGWFVCDKVVGKVPLLLGYTPESGEVQNGKVRLHLRSKDGTNRELVAEHVVAATGYRVSIERLKFLNADIRARVRAVNDSPVLSSTFESSVRGLYCVGVSAANSFGPVMRFAFGAGFAARTVTRTMTKVLDSGQFLSRSAG